MGYYVFDHDKRECDRRGLSTSRPRHSLSFVAHFGPSGAETPHDSRCADTYCSPRCDEARAIGRMARRTACRAATPTPISDHDGARASEESGGGDSNAGDKGEGEDTSSYQQASYDADGITESSPVSCLFIVLVFALKLFSEDRQRSARGELWRRFPIL
jgi:hypothetical protein